MGTRQSWRTPVLFHIHALPFADMTGRCKLSPGPLRSCCQESPTWNEVLLLWAFLPAPAQPTLGCPSLPPCLPAFGTSSSPAPLGSVVSCSIGHTHQFLMSSAASSPTCLCLVSPPKPAALSGRTAMVVRPSPLPRLLPGAALNTS